MVYLDKENLIMACFGAGIMWFRFSPPQFLLQLFSFKCSVTESSSYLQKCLYFLIKSWFPCNLLATESYQYSTPLKRHGAVYHFTCSQVKRKKKKLIQKRFYLNSLQSGFDLACSCLNITKSHEMQFSPLQTVRISISCPGLEIGICA